ncbi:TetR family transcriptional regulator [Paenibacillus baekrokdamisoli]|uniref:TetR family transcriptional regulator n=1 Tax=Paenibacillus baekrokdamisoli TaxID=1712516 RepID=A0A3G9JK79_9BACL|nr:TetR/AcrR family transcriptional regulator [Paenibacillus baekrokdamisoli]MBB3071441.1 AcrR family transcriptional regulator [Paenibacillus baekrokdamisoli]BBH24528.1 TetR family transcriptional regulator [Paenibacillus baekrokdamisoli]
MTSNRIREVSLAIFAKNGYEGSSLADISSEVGIKKQSIYTHFKGKDELFLAVLHDVFLNELKFVTSYIESHAHHTAEKALFGFLMAYKDRYEENDNTKFWLRMSFFPPSHLYEQVMKYVYDNLDKMESLFAPIMEKAASEGSISPSVGAERATVAFMGILDGVFVEMLYGGPGRLMKRIDASWYLYWRGVSKE